MTEAVATLVVAVSSIRPYMSKLGKARGQVTAALDSFAQWFREGPLVQAESNFTVAFKALSVAIREYHKEGTDAEDKDALKQAENQARSDIQALRNRLKDVSGDSVASKAQKDAAEQRKAEKGTVDAVNVKEDDINDLLRTAASILNGAIARLGDSVLDSDTVLSIGNAANILKMHAESHKAPKAKKTA